MYAFKLPDVGEGISEAELLEWRVAVGDVVAEGDEIAVVNTDKITVELPSPRAGTIRACHGEVGEIIAVGTVLVEIDDGSGEATEIEAAPATAAAPAAPAKARGKVKAAPATRRRARELGVDLAGLMGSGEGGAIRVEDVEAAAAGGDDARRIPLSGARATAARHLAQSVHTLATSTTSFEARGDGILECLEAAKPAAGERGPKLSPLAVIAKCLATVLSRHERFNATIDENANTLIVCETVELGLAVAAPEGLIVPVLRDAAKRSLLDLAADIAELSARARQGELKLADIRGASFTLSSTGGLEEATIISTRPIINPPQSAVLWVSRINERPRVADGRLEAGPMLAASLSFDHRYIDGAEATAFINDLVKLLEAPEDIS